MFCTFLLLQFGGGGALLFPLPTAATQHVAANVSRQFGINRPRFRPPEQETAAAAINRQQHQYVRFFYSLM